MVGGCRDKTTTHEIMLPGDGKLNGRLWQGGTGVRRSSVMIVLKDCDAVVVQHNSVASAVVVWRDTENFASVAVDQLENDGCQRFKGSQA